MQFNKIIKLLLCFVLIIPLLGTKASASNDYDHEALSEYEGYGEAMYESIVEQTTFITGQYTDNQEYVRGSMDQVKDYADFWYSEADSLLNGCFDASGFMDCLGNMTERSGAYLLTVGDWIKNLFNDYDETVNGELTEYDFTGYEQYFNVRDGGVFLNYEYSAKVSLLDQSFMLYGGEVFGVGVTSSHNSNDDNLPGSYTPMVNYLYGMGVSTTSGEVKKFIQRIESARGSITGTLSNLYYVGGSIVIYKKDNLNVPVSSPPALNIPDRNINNISRYVQENPVQLPVPHLKPELICPNGSKIQMSVSGSTFLAGDGTIMQVDKDGTATVNNQECLLDWQKPKVDYVEDQAAITDLKGNWLAIGTNNVLACLDPAGCELVPVDNSLLDYLKNSYDYATGVLKTATDGLKSLATGAKDLTSLFGVFFGWLPNEMVVLMASGLGITVGLRLFRK